MSAAEAAIDHIESRLRIPTGPGAGQPFRLYGAQKDWILGTFQPDVDVGVFCVGRGNGKTTLSAGIAHAALVGVLDDQPRREIVIVARTLEQGRVCYDYLCALIHNLPAKERQAYTVRRAPRLEVTYTDADGDEHTARVVASDGRSALGGSPTLVIMDERGHWPVEKGDLSESVHMTGAAKRGGKVLMISTSADNDLHTFSQWIDNPPPGTFVREYRADPDLPVDSDEAILQANPGCLEGVGASLETLRRAAQRALARGGSALTQFRWLTLNQRVADESRAVLLTTDEWLACEVSELPDRRGPCVIGLDAGENASMSAASYYWPETGRLEVRAWLPTEPPLAERGQNDRVGDRYLRMAERGELSLLGNKVVPVAEWVQAVLAAVHGQSVACLVADRFKQAVLQEGLQQAGINTPLVFRRYGFFDGDEDLGRFRAACLDQTVRTAPSLLMRAAIADTVVEKDVNGNLRLAKGRSKGRIDAVSAAVIAVAQGQRMAAQPAPKAPRVMWA